MHSARALHSVRFVTQIVAVLNTDAETLEGLALALGDAGFRPYTFNTVGTSRDEVARFIGSVNPDVVVYDLGPPYTEAIRHWDELSQTRVAKGRPFVLTTTGRGLEIGCFGAKDTEIVEKPFSFTRLVRAVHRAVRRCGNQDQRA
jgi:DNA-binding response OmpR family regulator